MRSPIVSSMHVTKNPQHWRISVWNRGGLAGTLTVDALDGPEVVSRLREHDTTVKTDRAAP